MFDLLFKQLGFNPADLKKQVDDAAANFNKVIDHFNSRFDIIEKQNKKIIDLLKGTDYVTTPANLAIEKLAEQPIQSEAHNERS